MQHGQVETDRRREAEVVRPSLTLVSQVVSVAQTGAIERLTVTRRGFGPIKTPHGKLRLYAFDVDDEWGAYEVIVSAPAFDDGGNPVFDSSAGLLLRLDSGCLTGRLGDVYCECFTQLKAAIARIAQEQGIVICIPAHEGRGQGLPFKLATLALQERGHDTVVAAEILTDGAPIDRRTYGGAIAVLKALSIRRGARLRVMTNNPLKICALTENGYVIAERVPLIVKATRHTRRHLAAKKEKLGHLL